MSHAAKRSVDDVLRGSSKNIVLSLFDLARKTVFAIPNKITSKCLSVFTRTRVRVFLKVRFCAQLVFVS